MFEDAAWMVLAVVGMVAFNAYREGRIGDWLRAKFLNAAQPSLPLGGVPADPTISGGGDWSTPSSQPPRFASLLGGIFGRPITGVPDPTDPDQHFGNSRGRPHEGVDWPAPAGTPVRASSGGRVTHAGAAGAYGLAVYLDHGNGVETRYAHLSRLNVAPGDLVNGGQLVGHVGSTGRSTGPHLHFELRRNGVAVDPLGALSSSSGGVTA